MGYTHEITTEKYAYYGNSFLIAFCTFIQFKFKKYKYIRWEYRP